MRSIVALCVLLFLIAGCAQATRGAPAIPDPQAFVCETDDDCVMQQTSCNNCGCPVAIRKEHLQPLDCDVQDRVSGCEIYCYPAAAACVNATCQAVRIEG